MTLEKDHMQTMALLPWYVNETLDGRDAELVLRHMAECDACRDERDRLYQLQDLVQETAAPDTGYKRSFEHVMARIDAAERDSRSLRDAEEFAQRRGFLPIGIAASVLVAVVAAGSFLQNLGTADQSSGEEYETLSSDALTAGASQRMELGFVNPIPAATLRQALIETDSNIVSGPDPQGNYIVEVMVPGGIDNADYLTRIQKIEGVERARFVEN